MKTSQPLVKKRQVTRRSPAQKAELLARYHASGVSKHEFCHQHNIHPRTFNGWLNPKSKPTKPPRFVEHHVVSPSLSLAIKICSGYSIHLSGSTDQLALFTQKVIPCLISPDH